MNKFKIGDIVEFYSNVYEIDLHKRVRILNADGGFAIAIMIDAGVPGYPPGSEVCIYHHYSKCRLASHITKPQYLNNKNNE